MESIRIWACIFLMFLVGCGGKKSTKPIAGDTTPPAAVQDLSLTSPQGRQVSLRWTATGDDGMAGQVSSYEIRYSATLLSEESWDSARAIAPPPVPRAAGLPQYYTVPSLPDGTYYFGIKAADEIPNWSAISNIVSATVADIVPPGPVSNLIVSGFTAHSATLSWTAPGNDGSAGRAAAYDIRYSLDSINEGTWNAATRARGTPTPAPPGTTESFTVDSLETGDTYYFALKTGDEAQNWSVLSNVASSVILDLTPPDRVTDLSAPSATETSVTLTWTAPGDNGQIGTAAEYDLRYASTLIYDGNWNGAVRVESVPAPGPAGTKETFVVTGLESGRFYYFALKTADQVPNWSVPSNNATALPGTLPMVRLTYSASRLGANLPAWSPDGQNIAFAADWAGSDLPRNQIFMMPANGGQAIQLTDIPAGASSPSWSSDGTKIAIVSSRTDDPYSLLAGQRLGWAWADPVAGLVGAALVAQFAWSLLVRAAPALLDMNPSPELAAEVRARLRAEGERVVDLHLWRLGPGHHAAVAVVAAADPQTPEAYRARLNGLAGLSHITIEVRRDG